MGCGLRISGRVVFVRKLAVNVNHLCTSRDIELLLRSTCSTLNDSHACTLGQYDLDSILTADRAGEDRGEFFLHDPDDAPTSTTHANPAARMGDLPLISTFHASFETVEQGLSRSEDECAGDTKLYPLQRVPKWPPKNLNRPSTGPLLGSKRTGLRRRYCRTVTCQRSSSPHWLSMSCGPQANHRLQMEVKDPVEGR